jgi:hypothetical protein
LFAWVSYDAKRHDPSFAGGVTRGSLAAFLAWLGARFRGVEDGVEVELVIRRG